MRNLPFRVTGEGVLLALFMILVALVTLIVIAFAWIDDNPREECYENGYIWTISDDNHYLVTCVVP